ncbi:MAG: MATE family efflux transporter [Clostridia bacterium]|nr:MATE family efflux transporter [Clostridia bacterium]
MITKDKNFYKTFFNLFKMLVIQNVIVLSVNLADNVMIGSYSETSLAGVAAVNQIQFVFNLLVVSLGDAMVVLGSQYWGQNDTNSIKKIANGALLSGVVFGVGLFFVATFLPAQLVGLFTKNDQIIAEGVEYLKIIKFTYLLFALTNLFLAILRCIEKVRIAFYTSLMSLVINCSINYCLIKGNFGFPQMGVTGAAIGTLTARTAELIVVVIYVFVFEKRLNLKIREIVKPDFSYIKDFLITCLPFAVVGTMFGLSTALQTVILGHLSDSAIAANSVSSTLYMVLKVASTGAASAASVVIGKTVGSGDLSKIKEYARTLQLIFLSIGILTSIVLRIVKEPVLSLYNLTPETLEMARKFIGILCITCIGTAYQMPVNTGIVRAGGDTKYVLKLDIVAIWCIVLPLSFLGAFKFHWAEPLVMFCLNSDQLFKAIPAVIKVNRYHWMKKLTR